MMKFFGTSRRRALAVAAGVSGAAGLSLTLVSLFAESPPPFAIFEFGALVAGPLGLVIMRRQAATPVPVRVVAESARRSTEMQLRQRMPSSPRRSTSAWSRQTPAETIPSDGARYEGANQIGLSEWLLAPVPMKDQDCDNAA